MRTCAVYLSCIGLGCRLTLKTGYLYRHHRHYQSTPSIPRGVRRSRKFRRATLAIFLDRLLPGCWSLIRLKSRLPRLHCWMRPDAAS